MIDWEFIKHNYPVAFQQFMEHGVSLEEFWDAYQMFVELRLIETETGEELWDFKIESKLIIFSYLSYKTVIRDGRRISVKHFSEVQKNNVNKIFELIELQIKNRNYLNN